MNELIPLAEQAGALLKQRKETVAIAESSAGGLISAALLTVGGASAYFLGGGVVYTAKARSVLLGLEPAALTGMRPSTEAYALLSARTAHERFGSTWALAETGATGPTGNRYGDAAGHACFALVGPREEAITIETGSADRVANMRAFAKAGLAMLLRGLG